MNFQIKTYHKGKWSRKKQPIKQDVPIPYPVPKKPEYIHGNSSSYSSHQRAHLNYSAPPSVKIDYPVPVKNGELEGY